VIFKRHKITVFKGVLVDGAKAALPRITKKAQYFVNYSSTVSLRFAIFTAELNSK